MIAEYSVLRPITVVMATVSVAVLGFISLGKLPLELLPEFNSPHLRVSVNYPSSSPEEVERKITRPLEEVLSTLNYLESVRSTSSAGGANVGLEFVQGTNMDLVALDVRDRIDQVRNRLPQDVDQVTIRRWQTTDMPVFRFSLGWRGSREDLYRFSDHVLRPRLERIDGVASVEMRGVDPKQIIIDLDPELLETHGIDLSSLAQALRSNNVNVSSGYVLDASKKFNLRTVGEFASVEEIAQVPLQGGRLTLADVASVRHDFPERDSFSRLNGEEAVTLSVYKASTANVVEVCQAVRGELEAIQEEGPYAGSVLVRIFSDQSEEILKSLDDLKQAGLFGGLLAMVVLFLFLMKLRSTLIISLAIPVSVVFTFAFMYLLSVAGVSISLNVVSLMALMVAVGMLVDSSVVVLENIFRYKQEQGLDAQTAAVKGSREVGVAVLASTATTVIVFVSAIFSPSSVGGRYVRDFGIVVTAALIAALVVSLTLTPMLASRIFTGRERPKQRIMVWLTEAYGGLMSRLLRYRFVTLILMAAIGYATFVLFTSIDRELFPRVGERQIRLEVLMERSFSPEEMQGIFHQIETTLMNRAEELEMASLSTYYNARTTRRGQFRGEVNLYLKDEGKVTPTPVLQEKMRAALPTIPGVEIQFGRRRSFGGGGEMGVEVQLVGDNSLVLRRYGELVKEKLAELGGIQDLQTTLESGDDEIHLKVDRKKTEQLGISASQVARTISAALSTRATTRYKSENGEVDIILQLRGGNEIRLQELQNMRLQNRQGEMVPLYSVLEYEYQKGPMSIERDDRQAVLRIMGNTDRGGGLWMSQMVGQAMSEIALPPGYSWSLGRQWQRFRESEAESFFALLLAIIFMYIVMAALFESFVHPLTILFTVPFSLIGVAAIFHLTSTTLNQMAYLGIMVLFGIVVNNGIILVHHINVLRAEGLARRDAIVTGGMHRLRPILMTAATSVFGLLPLTVPFFLPDFFPAVEGRARMWAPVSLAVLGGLTTSTLLTLIILPAVYSYMDDLSLLCVRTARFAYSFVARRSQPAANA